MNRESSSFRPFLTRYEVDIPQCLPAREVEYDESRMILTVGGEPVDSALSLSLPGGTRYTRVGQETTDDD